jgi:hypothetical protein
MSGKRSHPDVSDNDGIYSDASDTSEYVPPSKRFCFGFNGCSFINGHSVCRNDVFTNHYGRPLCKPHLSSILVNTAKWDLTRDSTAKCCFVDSAKAICKSPSYGTLSESATYCRLHLELLICNIRHIDNITQQEPVHDKETQPDRYVSLFEDWNNEH